MGLATGREIEVDESAHRSERGLLDTLIHESLHAADGEMSERKVCQIAADITDVLWRTHWRRVIPKPRKKKRAG